MLDGTEGTFNLPDGDVEGEEEEVCS